VEWHEPTLHDVTVNTAEGTALSSDHDKAETIPAVDTKRLLPAASWLSDEILPARVSDVTSPDTFAVHIDEAARPVEIPLVTVPEIAGVDSLAVRQQDNLGDAALGLALNTSVVDLTNLVHENTQVGETAPPLVTEESAAEISVPPMKEPALATDCDPDDRSIPVQYEVETVEVEPLTANETVETANLVEPHESENVGTVPSFANDGSPLEMSALQIEESREDEVWDTRLPEAPQAVELIQIAPASSVGNDPVETCEHSIQEQGEPAEVSQSVVVGQNNDETTELAVPPVAEAVETAPAPDSDHSVTGMDAPSTQEMAATIENVSSTAADEKTDLNAGPDAETAQVVEVTPTLGIDESPAVLSEKPAEETKHEGLSSAGMVKDESPSRRLLNFYGLSEQPFQVTPDPAYLYLTEMHREALTSLVQGVQDLRGFMALIAEPGMGKTTLLNKLMQELGESARTAFLFQTQCNSRELLRYLLGELGVKHAGMDAVTMHRVLNEILFQEMLHGRRFVLIVDEAQNLHESVLETIRLLSDFETDDRKLIQIVLAGQPQLVDTLMQPSLAQLRQRIAILCNLESLSVDETCAYIEHRLHAAGQTGEAIFTREAMELIAERSEGTPRSINNLCFNALVSGYAQGTRTIDSAIVRKVAKKLDLSSLRRTAQPTTPLPGPSGAIPIISPQDPSVISIDLNRHDQKSTDTGNDPASKPSFFLRGKLTEKLQCRSWGKETEFRIQVSLERESPADIPVADRYYCCTFYVGEEHAARLKVGQALQIKIEH